MDSKIVVTCFTDLKGSTELTEKLRHDGIRPYREEHLRIGRLLCELVGGKYIKSIGDAHMIGFDTLEPAFRFSTQLQQYYLPQSCYEKAPLQVRIGLFLGVVEESGDGDLFGSGVNQAARVEGKTPAGEVWVNKDLVGAINKVWSREKPEKYFDSRGEFQLKGIKEPPKQELFSFNWLTYANDHPENSLAQIVHDHLEEASVTPSNLSVEDLAKPSFVIWPVVPRDVVNAIHRGQIEMIRLLMMLGWKVYILIADCGITESFTREYANEFRKLVEKYAQKRSIINLVISFMSDLYCPGQNDCHHIHRYFQNVISDLTLQDLIGINQKGYKEDIEAKVKEKPTLDFLRPALTIAAVLRISEQLGGRCIVLVGHDEEIQWTRAHDIPGSRAKVGVLFNPVLKDKEGYQNRQTKNWPHWDSWQAMLRDMERTNLALWTTKMHAFIPAFPSPSIAISGKEFKPEDWKDEKAFNENVNKKALARQVFDSILNI